MDENIQNYRQPMVTAIGIILGFVLGFTGKWATDSVSQTHFSDYIISIGLLLSIILLIVSLFRILNNNYPKDSTAKYYNATLKIFIFGISFAFVGILISIFQTIFSH
jgi:ABC-type dipeptide/oligopeptide/nickel transport system permease subunit